MAKYFRGHTSVEGVAMLETSWAVLPETAKQYPHFAIAILDEDEYLTDRQIRWYKGVCLRQLSDWNGDTPDEWDYRLKTECGAEIFKMLRYECNGKECFRPQSITSKGKKKMTQFIENILSKSITMDWPVVPPDPELRRL